MLKFPSEVKVTVFFRHVLAIIFLVSTPLAFAADQNQHGVEPLTVAVAECPPFVIVNENEHSGLAIYLWEQVSQEMGLEWEYVNYSLGSFLDAIGSEEDQRSADVGISCVSVTAEREKLVDFSHSFFETHTAIAVRQTTLWSTVVGFFTDPRVLKAVFTVLGIAALIGGVFYLLEHKINKKLFSKKSSGGRFLEAIIIGLLFVTHGPIRFYSFKTLTARTLAAVLAISSTFLIAGITAVLASSFTLNSLQTQVRDLHDLRKIRVGALDASTSSAFLRVNGITHQTRQNLDDLVTDLDAGDFDAIVSDAAFLQYRINKGKELGQFESLSVLPYEFEAQNYAFVLGFDSPYREAINRALLTVRMQREWRDKVTEYLGN